MKQTILSVVLALSLMLCGCGGTVPETIDASQAATTPAAPAEPSSAPENQQLRLAVETDGTISALSGCEAMLAVMQVDGTGHASLLTIDPISGEPLGQAAVSDPYVDLLAFPEGVATFCWDSSLLTVYSPAMEQLWTQTLPNGTFGSLQSDACFYLFSDDGAVSRIALSNRSQQTISVPEGLTALDLFLCMENGSLLRCSDGEGDGSFFFLWLDWNHGTAEPVELSAPELYLGRGRFFETIPGHESLWLCNPLQQQSYRLEADNAWVIQSEADRVLCEVDRKTLAVYDLEQGTAVRRPTAGISNAVLCGDLVAYQEIETPGRVFLWNPPPSSAEQDAVQIWTPGQLTAEAERMAEAVTVRSGMSVFWGEAGTDYNHGFGTSYVSEAVTDPLTVYLGLEQLMLLVEEYPEGIFQEMCTEAFQPIEVYLCGPIRGNQYGTDPVGFTSFTGKAQIVVLDLGATYDPDALRSTMAHEFMHVMENRIDQLGWEKGIDYLTYWMSFIPDPALYFYNHFDYMDYQRNPSDYTAGSSRPVEEVLFLDAYSRTNPMEDRARILEFLYSGEKSSYASNLQAGVLSEKAQYLCAVIRACFPSCQIEGKLPWETLVEVIPFSEYEESVRTYEPQPLG